MMCVGAGEDGLTSCELEVLVLGLFVGWFVGSFVRWFVG
jgi:hypothetical protein